MAEKQEGRPLYIRADASSKIGAGHVMRCLALAQAWRSNEKGKVVFLSNLEGEALRQTIVEKGFEVIDIPYPYPHPDDANQLLKTVVPSAGQTNWLVLDGYHFDAEYQLAAKGSGAKLLVIDDMAHLPVYHCDMLLNQNIYAENLSYCCDAETDLLRGTKYALLREEFLGQGHEQQVVPEQARHVLVTLGGADPDNVTSTVLQALKLLALPDLEVKIVVGPANPHMDQLVHEVKDISCSCELLKSVDDMPSLMRWADLAISAAGSTCWELAYMEVPFLLVILAENQKRNAEALAERAAAVNLGWHSSLETEDLSRVLAEVVNNSEKRAAMIDNGTRLVDGNGVKRILMKMLPPSLQLRKAIDNDCELLFQWANDSEVRNVSFHTQKITWDEHRDWFHKKLVNQHCLFYICETVANEPVGQVRFDCSEHKAIISASISEDFRSYGRGSEMLRLACKRVANDYGKALDPIEAFIKQDNTKSRKAFEKAGFRKVSEITHCGVPTIVMHYCGNNE